MAFLSVALLVCFRIVPAFKVVSTLTVATVSFDGEIANNRTSTALPWCSFIRGRPGTRQACTCEGKDVSYLDKTTTDGSRCVPKARKKLPTCTNLADKCNFQPCDCKSHGPAEKVKLLEMMSDGAQCYACRKMPDQVQSCYVGEDGEDTNGHGYFVLSSYCDMQAGSLDGVLNGCGFSSDFSRQDGIGWGGGNNSGAEKHRGSSGGSGLWQILSPLPFVRTGHIHDELPICDNPIDWDVPEACMRAVFNEVGKEFEEHRQWTYSKALSWMLSNQDFRKPDCKLGPGLLSRERVLEGSWNGTWKRDDLCWDFVLGAKSLYCDARKSGSKAPYHGICGYDTAGWARESKRTKVVKLLAVEARSVGFLIPAAKATLETYLRTHFV